MSPGDLVALMRRHLIAVAVILALAIGVAYKVTHTAQGFTDTATVAFFAPKSNGLFGSVSNLLVIDELAANSMMSAAGQHRVSEAGGTASYGVALVNLNTEDYPNYSNPYVTVTTTSLDAGAAQRTFSVVMQVLKDDVARLQERQGASPNTWIQIREIAAPSGPIAQTGSRKRTLGGLAILIVIVILTTTRFLDKHQVRLRDLKWRGAVRAGLRAPSRSRVS